MSYASCTADEPGCLFLWSVVCVSVQWLGWWLAVVRGWKSRQWVFAWVHPVPQQGRNFQTAERHNANTNTYGNPHAIKQGDLVARKWSVEWNNEHPFAWQLESVKQPASQTAGNRRDLYTVCQYPELHITRYPYTKAETNTSPSGIVNVRWAAIPSAGRVGLSSLTVFRLTHPPSVVLYTI